MASAGQIDLDLHVNRSGFNSEMNNIGNNAGGMLSGAFKKLGGIIAATFAITALTRFGMGAIKLASDLNEVQNVVDVTFGNMTNQINAFSKTALQQFGLSELGAKKFASTMGAMLKSSGLTGQAMTDMSMGIAGLAGDMASFYNLDPQEAFNKIRSGISGETEPLKQLGVNMSVANMEAYAMAQGISTSYAKMSQANKSLLRYNYLLSVTKDAQGDFARTSGTWANQVRILSTQWNIFKGTMGQGFINMLTPVLGWLNALILKLQVAAQYFAAFMTAIFGSAAASGAAATAAAMAKVNATSSAAAASTDKLGGAVKKTAAAIKGSLASFDQLNVLNKDTASGADGAAGGMGGAGSVPGLDVPVTVAPKLNTSAIDTITAPLKKFIDEIIAPLKEINFEPLVSAFGRLKLAIEPFTDAFFAGLKWAYLNIFVPLAKWTIENVLPAFLDILSGCYNVLNPLLTTFKPLASWLWDNFLLPIATWTGGVIVSVLQGIADALNEVSSWMTNNKETVDTITNLVIGFFAAWSVVKIVEFIEISGGIAMLFGKIAGKIWLATGARVAHALSVVAGTLALVAYNIIMLVTKGIVILATAAVWLFNAALAILTSPITLVIGAIALLALGVVLMIKHWDDIKAAGAGAWKGISKAWDAVGTWFSKNVIKPIADGFKGLWNGIIDGMNWVIRGLNKIKIPEMNIMGKKIGGFGINIDPIKRLANGGLVSSPTLAMVGDNKGAARDPEVIAPLSKLQDMLGKSNSNAEMISLLDKILTVLNNQQGDIILKLSDTEFGRVAIKSINKTQRQSGITLLTV